MRHRADDTPTRSPRVIAAWEPGSTGIRQGAGWCGPWEAPDGAISARATAGQARSRKGEAILAAPIAGGTPGKACSRLSPDGRHLFGIDRATLAGLSVQGKVEQVNLHLMAGRR